MTEKRFEIDSIMYGATDVRYWLKDNANELIDDYSDKIYWGDGSTNGLKQIVNKLNEFYEENQHLRKALKKEYMAISGNLCDACKHEEKDNTNNWFVGIDYDVKCKKGHKILLDDEEQECEDFELRLEELEE